MWQYKGYKSGQLRNGTFQPSIVNSNVLKSFHTNCGESKKIQMYQVVLC